MAVDSERREKIDETLHKEFEDAQQQLRNGALQHLSSLVDQVDYSDLEFVCSDEIRVKATKALLKGRSPVLDAMLTNGMLESSQSVIKLPEISSPVVLYLLDILYAGASVHHPLVGWRRAFEAIRAANFFCLPNVIKIVRKFLWAEVVEAARSWKFSDVASMLTMAMKVKCVPPDEDDIVLEMGRLLYCKWSQFECAVNLSEEAVAFILQKTKPKLETEFSLAEYFRIREVVLWCVYQATMDSESAAEAKRLVDNSMPLKKEGLYKVGDVVTVKTKIVWLPTRDKFDLKGDKLCQLLSKECCKNAIARLLKIIKRRSIPATLLVEIIGPLQILFSPQRMVFHDRLFCKWKHDSTYTTEKHGFVIRKSSKGNYLDSGWAIFEPAARCYDGILQWRFVLDKFGPSRYRSIRLGLARATPTQVSQYGRSGTKSHTGILFKDLMAFHVMECGKVVSSRPWNRKERHVDLPDSISVLFTFDQKEWLCTAHVDGHEEIACQCRIPPTSSLTDQYIFPTVDLELGAQVHIEIVNGFKLL